jgi:hypothetical protein
MKLILVFPIHQVAFGMRFAFDNPSELLAAVEVIKLE